MERKDEILGDDMGTTFGISAKQNSGDCIFSEAHSLAW